MPLTPNPNTSTVPTYEPRTLRARYLIPDFENELSTNSESEGSLVNLKTTDHLEAEDVIVVCCCPKEQHSESDDAPFGESGSEPEYTHLTDTNANAEITAEIYCRQSSVSAHPKAEDVIVCRCFKEQYSTGLRGR